MPVALTPAPKIVALDGDAITVQLRNLPGTVNEVVLHITRNGAREERFTITELAQVLTVANAQLAKARTKTLNTPDAKP